jgi:hypothetical protein
MSAEPESTAAAGQAIRTLLEEKKQRTYEEIRNYPRPIPACDQHFNYLLEEQDRICLELSRLEDPSTCLEPGHEGANLPWRK